MKHQTTYDRHLIEKAVLVAIESAPSVGRAEFRRHRDRCYEIVDPDLRDADFDRLHRAWFLKLELGHPIEQALSESALLRRVRECRVVAAPSRARAHADLFDYGSGRDPGAPVETEGSRSGLLMLLRLTPESFSNSENLLGFLRHECLHISDMLDPAFGYRRELPASEVGPAYENVLRKRYCVVWDATIDGRLVRTGRAPGRVRTTRGAEFVRAFPALGADATREFERWFEGEQPTHGAIVDFIVRAPSTRASSGGYCPICRFPTARLDPNPSRLSGSAVRELQLDRPGWQPIDGLCVQCADLYEARHTRFATP